MIQRISFLLFLLFTALSCTNNDVDKKFDCEKSDLSITLEAISFSTSCDAADGEIRVTALGGKQPYFYFLNDNGVALADPIFSSLASGIYSVTVKDKNDCEAVLSNLAVLAEGFKFSANILENTECFGGNGSITINVLEGNGPFNYKIGTGQFSEKNTFTNLRHGNHTILVEDATKCGVQLNITVPKGNSGTSWSSDILPIIKASCAVSGCHDGKTRTDYRIYDNVKREADQVKALTKNKSMPFDGPALQQTQIDLIACWVDDGAPNN